MGMASLEMAVEKIKNDVNTNSLLISGHCRDNFRKKDRSNIKYRLKKTINKMDKCFIERNRVIIVKGILRLVFNFEGVLITAYNDRRLRK